MLLGGPMVPLASARSAVGVCLRLPAQPAIRLHSNSRPALPGPRRTVPRSARRVAVQASQADSNDRSASSPDSQLTRDDVLAMKLRELRMNLDARGLDTTGLKARPHPSGSPRHTAALGSTWPAPQ